MSNKAPRYPGSRHRFVLVFCISLLSFACSPPEEQVESGTTVDDAAMSDELQGDNWLVYGRTYSEQ